MRDLANITIKEIIETKQEENKKLVENKVSHTKTIILPALCGKTQLACMVPELHDFEEEIRIKMAEDFKVTKLHYNNAWLSELTKNIQLFSDKIPLCFWKWTMISHHSISRMLGMQVSAIFIPSNNMIKKFNKHLSESHDSQYNDLAEIDEIVKFAIDHKIKVLAK